MNKFPIILTKELDPKKRFCYNGESFDFKTKENVKIEVKSAAFIQSWEQKKLSQIRFDIAPKRSGNYSEKKVRNSDLYIFCLLHHKDQNTINPMDLNQWTFYLILTEEINQTCKSQLSVGISTLERLKHIKTDFSGIKESYLKAISSMPNRSVYAIDASQESSD